ncbi:MAG: response regulator transcription factor, partial [Verrucomicrobiae bacterium]|nr:response regulator transcription factor [Verrucomicrobiae bacterium]
MNPKELTFMIVDDEPAVRKMLRAALDGSATRIHEAATGRDGLVSIAQHQPDIVLLDLGLPGLDGFEVLKRLREWTDVPVIVLTVRDDAEDKIAALDAGADDYVTKPFHTGELLARIRSVAKRLRPEEHEPIVRIGSLVVDFLEHRAEVSGHPVKLTPIEFRLLLLLAKHRGKVVTKTQILREVWPNSTTTSDDHLRVHLAAIRRKLREVGCDHVILTEPGVG